MNDSTTARDDANAGPAGVAAGTESRAARLRALGSEIRSRRGRQGLSTSALARSRGVSPSLISQVERGLTAPSLDVMWEIAAALGLPVDTLFPGPGGH